jgi:hypothetical protein
MAGTTVAARSDGMAGGTIRATRIELNKAVDDLDALRTKVNAIITAAATNIAAVAAVPAAAAIAAAKVADQDGTTT